MAIIDFNAVILETANYKRVKLRSESYRPKKPSRILV